MLLSSLESPSQSEPGLRWHWSLGCKVPLLGMPYIPVVTCCGVLKQDWPSWVPSAHPKCSLGSLSPTVCLAVATALRRAGFLESRALGNLALSSAEIWLLTLNDFLSYDVLCYLTGNKSGMLTARLSPSLAFPEAALHQPPSHVLLLSPLLMTLHKCSTLFLGHFLCVPRLTVLGCAGWDPAPPAGSVPHSLSRYHLDQVQRARIMQHPRSLSESHWWSLQYSTALFPDDPLCPSPLSPTKPCMAVLCSQPPVLHLTPNIPRPSCVQPFPPSWGKENSPTAVVVYKCSSERFAFSFFFFFSWGWKLAPGVFAPAVRRKGTAEGEAVPWLLAPNTLHLLSCQGRGQLEPLPPSHIPVGVSLVEDRS